MRVDCPRCGDKTAVLDSRPRVTSNRDLYGMIYRRRECSVCQHRFTTYEVSEDVMRRMIQLEQQIKGLQDLLAPAAGRRPEPALPKLRGTPIPRKLLQKKH